MKTKGRSGLVIPLLVGVALVVASCAETRREEVEELVRQYLDYEVAGDHWHQRMLADLQSATILPMRMGEVTNPFDPKKMVSYEIRDVTVEGATAQAQVVATFQVIWPGGMTGAEERHVLTIHVVHEHEQWRVDEIKTRTEALDTVMGERAGETWLLTQQHKRQFSQP